MRQSFLSCATPPLTLLYSPHTEEEAISTAYSAIDDGVEAFAIQTMALAKEFRNASSYHRIFKAMGDRPIYVTNYRLFSNEGVSDEEIGEHLLYLADCGATLCDIMGDLYDRQPDELTMSPKAIEKQIRLSEQLHKAGAEVLMSSHVFHYLPAEEVLRIAKQQESRGVDIAKIVTGASTMAEQIENLRISTLLHDELACKYLFLSGGECTIHRRIGPMLGNCMMLCCIDDTVTPRPVQPMLRKMKQIRDAWR